MVVEPDSDRKYMRVALSLAKRGVGCVAPNPSVGCVIVNNHEIVGRGNTAFGGRPHAETIALERSGNRARGATVYVTLEPCCHYGNTAPCTNALIKAGVVRVVVAIEDPYNKVAGKGIEALKEAGIRVDIGIGEAEAREVNAGFFSVQERGRPWITLKMATSKDEKITNGAGKSPWMTGDLARKYAHLLRARNDAIMVGGGTMRADNPHLTCRLPGMEERSPIRILLTKAEPDPALNVLQNTLRVPTWQIKESKHLATAMQHLAEKGITRLLVEGGTKLAESLWQENLVDQLVWIASPHTVGEEGLPALSSLSLGKICQHPAVQSSQSRMIGEDKLTILTFDYSKLL